MRGSLYCSVMETHVLVQCVPPTLRQNVGQTFVVAAEQSGMKETPWYSVMVSEGGSEGGREEGREGGREGGRRERGREVGR